jgi:hypothetical protein
VGEEDAQEDGVEQHRRRDAEPGELLGAQMSDDRAVGEQEERLGEQGAERGQGESHDLAVVRAGVPAGFPSARRRGGGRPRPHDASISRGG